MHSAYADGGDHRIVGCSGEEYRGSAPWAEIERSLARSLGATWQRGRDGRIDNPLDFYLVSFNPTIVIACAPGPSATGTPRVQYTDTFRRPLFIGTELACAKPEFWTTTPNGKLNPLAPISETERRIDFQGTVIALRQVSGRWLAFREGR
jgi:hypothetical protein